MPLCSINIDGAALSAPQTAEARLRAALADTRPGAPVVVLIHGYKFSPSFDRTSPHSHILSMQPSRGCWKALSWPRALGLGTGRGDEPLCIALGWEARGSIWRAYRRAAETGRALAGLVETIRRLRPGTRVEVLAHSLGCRVALAALPHLPADAFGRLVLMAPAEMRSSARRWLDTPAGQTAEVLSVTSHQNRMFDLALAWLVAPHRPGDRAVGAGRPAEAVNWTHVNIDAEATRQMLTAQGYPIAPADRPVCHWSVYLRPGLFPFYRAVLTRDLSLDPFKQLAAAAARPPRSRLGDTLLRPLSFAQRHAS